MYKKTIGFKQSLADLPPEYLELIAEQWGDNYVHAFRAINPALEIGLTLEQISNKANSGLLNLLAPKITQYPEAVLDALFANFYNKNGDVVAKVGGDFLAAVALIVKNSSELVIFQMFGKFTSIRGVELRIPL